MTQSIAIIINPVSGRRGHHKTTRDERATRAQQLADTHQTSIAIEVTHGPGHGAELARAFVRQGVDRVIAWGGDGTINEVAGPLIGTRTALGIVAAGSGDGLARSLGLPTGPDRAIATAFSSPATPMDVGFIAGRHFLNIAGIGFDAAAGTVFNRRSKRGAGGYLAVGMSTLWSYRCCPYEVQLDDQSMDGHRFLIAFANGREYGNGMVLSADANPRDGWLDAVLVDAGPAILQLWRTRRLIVGRRRPAAGVRRLRVRTAVVKGARLVCHVDGETFEAKDRVDVRLEPGAILVAGL
jgi:YegS/Rv2252/BmrU family lipid kinase